MIKITAPLVKELRKRTGAGIMDCKKALTEMNGNIELAIKNIYKYSSVKLTTKIDTITTDGIVKTKISGNNYGVILEVNCQTDFVAKENNVQIFIDRILNFALCYKITDINILRAHFEEERISLITKVGENINIRRIAVLEGNIVNHYTHHGMRIGVLVAARSDNNKITKNIAMHIAANKPRFIKPEDVPIEVIKSEFDIQSNIAMQSNKSKEITDKIIKGRMKKFVDEISLTGQAYIMDLNKKVGQILKENNIDIINFIRFELGEK